MRRLSALAVSMLACLALAVGVTSAGPPSRDAQATTAGVSAATATTHTALDAAATSGDAKPAATANATRTIPGKTPTQPPKALYTRTGCNPAKPKPHTVTCNSLFKAGKDLRPLTSNAGPLPDSLGPADIQAAYDLPDGGAGKTVAIIDAL
ncbi:hypothetical protein ABZU76_51435, partial [Amycolatopsis sp. NPDC005232]